MKLVELTIPKMGESINEVKILKWLKKEGDLIKEEESILEVSTDKVDTEIPSLFQGKIKKIISKEGDIVQIGNPIAQIEANDNDNDNDPIKLADELFNDAVESFSSEDKKIINKKNESETNNFFSPLVLNIAKEENISINELEKINGSGKENRITKLDLIKYLDLKKSKSKNKKLKSRDNEKIIEPDRVRKLIAEKMVESKKISPHVTSFVDCDISKQMKDRSSIKNSFLKKHRIPLSINSIFIYALCRAIKKFPMINISYVNQKIIMKKNINIGLAVALDDGNLIVPIIKNVESLTFIEINKKVNDLIVRARENKLIPDELTEGTYTMSNIGSFHNLMGTPIILQPQVAIMAFGEIKKTPCVVERKNKDEIQIRHKLILSHSYDHRVIDGALGGKFAERVSRTIKKLSLKKLIRL
tara:strand:+ start:2934 stop:4181 length:1248 start_codon:yes stop_codon:yes gene_type:complete